MWSLLTLPLAQWLEIKGRWMSREEWFKPKWLWLKRFALIAAVGLVLGIVGVATEFPASSVLGTVLAIPVVVWLALIPILHWKDRYIGQCSGPWGGFLALETSGWSKVIYWFRHVLPDWRRTGRYGNTS